MFCTPGSYNNRVFRSYQYSDLQSCIVTSLMDDVIRCSHVTSLVDDVITFFHISFSSNTLLSAQGLGRNLVAHDRFAKLLEQFALERFAEIISYHLSCGTVFDNQVAFLDLVR